MNEKRASAEHSSERQEHVPEPCHGSKAPWHSPKLTFVEPTLTKEGELNEITGQGFFGTFIP